MNYTFIISHSSGELDIILPIIIDLKKNNKNQVEILVTRKDIFYSIKEDVIYNHIIHSNKICYKLCPLFNKFEHNKYNKIAARLYKLFLSIIFLIKNVKIIKSEYIIFETTNQISKDLVFYVLNSFLKKKFFIIHHGHSYNTPIKNTKLNPTKPKNYKYLIFSKKHIQWCKSIGYYNYHIIGFPKFYDNWKKEILKYRNLYQKNNYIIFSRPPHKYYMSKKNYKYLLNSSIESILKFDKNCNIIIKPHPREKIYEIKKNLKKKYQDITNIKFSFINSMSLCKDAKLIISFFTSAILESIIFNKPALEYFIEHKNFKKVEPVGSPYKNLGFTLVRNKSQLSHYLRNPNKINKIIKKNYNEFNYKSFKLY